MCVLCVSMHSFCCAGCDWADVRFGFTTECDVSKYQWEGARVLDVLQMSRWETVSRCLLGLRGVLSGARRRLFDAVTYDVTLWDRDAGDDDTNGLCSEHL